LVNCSPFYISTADRASPLAYELGTYTQQLDPHLVTIVSEYAPEEFRVHAAVQAMFWQPAFEEKHGEGKHLLICRGCETVEPLEVDGFQWVCQKCLKQREESASGSSGGSPERSQKRRLIN
jgi:hypothetical protein